MALKAEIYTKILRAVLKISWKQHLTKEQLYSHLSPITQTIRIRRKILAGEPRTISEVYFFMDTYTWTHLYGSPSKNLHRYWILCRGHSCLDGIYTRILLCYYSTFYLFTLFFTSFFFSINFCYFIYHDPLLFLILIKF